MGRIDVWVRTYIPTHFCVETLLGVSKCLRTSAQTSKYPAYLHRGLIPSFINPIGKYIEHHSYPEPWIYHNPLVASTLPLPRTPTGEGEVMPGRDMGWPRPAYLEGRGGPLRRGGRFLYVLQPPYVRETLRTSIYVTTCISYFTEALTTPIGLNLHFYLRITS